MSKISKLKINVENVSSDIKANEWATVGVHEGGKLTKFEMATTKTGSSYLRISGETSKGEKFSNSYFDVDPSRIQPRTYKRNGEPITLSVEDIFMQDVTSRIGSIKHIMNSIIDIELINSIGEIESLVEFYKKATDLMEANADYSKKVNFILEYQRNNSWTKFPDKIPFIEPHVDGEKTSLAISPYHRMSVTNVPSSNDRVVIPSIDGVSSVTPSF